MKAPSNGRRLSKADAALVKGMIARHDRQHDIAAYFAVNGGRIGETSTGAQFATVATATVGLPPKAPYLVIDAALRAEAEIVLEELKKGTSAGTLAAMQKIVDAMEASRVARQGK